MEWLTENWFWVLLGVGFIFMHLFGHGGHKKQHDTEKNSKHRH